MAFLLKRLFRYSSISKSTLTNTNPFYLVFFGLSLAFSVMIKLLAITGIIILVRTEKAALSLFILTGTALMVASYIFLGQPDFVFIRTYPNLSSDTWCPWVVQGLAVQLLQSTGSNNKN